MCKELRVLPRAGGLLDQDYYHIKLIRAALQAFGKKEQKELNEHKAKANVSKRR